VRLLLDTHAFLWWIGYDRRLSRRARSAIGRGSNDCYVSIATAWEIAIKVSLGSLSLEGSLERFLPEQVAANGCTE
jgi:PIN domain nuclease of toxin-antitoxin system